ncbi:pyridoxamine 5'-phosphate oxidase family protein [Streptomyces sp. NPDC059092]|uniref:pyridoxamine 5'-phosphate oxidase family protein n=1 Tax=Streptomyces sp. NPDC059092 TaxID=3346725 RepID=UPI00368DFC99
MAAEETTGTTTGTTGTTGAEKVRSGGPGPRALTDAALSDFLGERQFGTLATVKRDGHPHLTTMVYHWDPEERTVRFSSTADRLKVRQIGHNPLAALHVSSDDHWTFAVAEGEAEVSDPTTTPGDAVGRELLTLLPAAARPNLLEDETAFFAQQVAERRVVIRLRVGRLYGTALDIAG